MTNYGLDFPLMTQPNQHFGSHPFLAGSAAPSSVDDYDTIFPTEYTNLDYLNFSPYTAFNLHSPQTPHPALSLTTANTEVAPQSRQGPGVSGNNEISPGNEKSMAARLRKKAQNRAAQRAYRERKERQLKELEDKLGQMESACSDVSDLNEKLKLQLQELSAEKESLRAIYRSLQGSMPEP